MIHKSIIPETITIICDDCKKEFRWLQTSTINPLRCRICENIKLLSKSTLYVKKTKDKEKDDNYTVKGKKAVKNPKKRKIDEELDAAWSILVKLKAGYKCEVCFIKSTLNSHHIYSRQNKSTRWHIPNGISLCINHHIGFKFSAHKTPVDFTMWLIETKGEKFMQDLKIKSMTTSHYSFNDKEVILYNLKKQIEILNKINE